MAQDAGKGSLAAVGEAGFACAGFDWEYGPTDREREREEDWDSDGADYRLEVEAKCLLESLCHWKLGYSHFCMIAFYPVFQLLTGVMKCTLSTTYCN